MSRWRPALAGAGALAGLGLFLATRPRSQLYGATVVRGRTQRRVVALTFDDGPNEPYTSQVLEVLGRHGVPATFFLAGENVARHPETARRIAAAGHVVGNHSQRHRPLDAFLDWRGRELERAQREIVAAIGRAPRLYRPPYGLHTPWQLRAARRRGLVPVQWSGEADDPHRPGAAAIARRLLRALRPGAILLLHDGGGTRPGADRGQTVAALPAVIEGARRRGYRFVPLPDLIGEAAYQDAQDADPDHGPGRSPERWAMGDGR